MDKHFQQILNNLRLLGMLLALQQYQTKQLTEAQKDADVIELHVHCPGGDVFEGSVIYNAIKESPTPVDVYIDGMAASMASVIMLAARKIYMAENAFIMIHAPHTFSCGNAEDLEKAAHLLRSIEANFIEAFCARTGKEKDAVAEWLKGDNWFSAQEAADEKLIDGIVGASDIQIESTEDDLKKTNATALLQRFEAIAKIKPTAAVNLIGRYVKLIIESTTSFTFLLSVHLDLPTSRSFLWK